MNEMLAAKDSFRFAGHEISWAGFCPWTGKPCFGTGDGKLLLLGDAEEESKGVPALHIFEDEAVNGVAFSDSHMAISSRSQVRFMPSPLGSGSPLPPQLICDQGAHGVSALESGGFIAPLGHDGLLLMQQNGNDPTIRVGRIPGKPINFYQLNALEQGPSGEIFAAAARTSGLLSLTLQGESITSWNTHRFEGIDIVSVCSLKSASWPRAVVALNRDGRLLWTVDILEDKPPQMIELDGLTGTMNSVFSAHGHVFTLTDSKLITMPHLAEKFLTGVAMNLPIDAMDLSIEAVDAFLVGDDELFVIAGDEVFSFSVNDLVAGTSRNPGTLIADPSQGVSFRPSILKLDWSISEPAFGELVFA